MMDLPFTSMYKKRSSGENSRIALILEVSSFLLPLLQMTSCLFFLKRDSCRKGREEQEEEEEEREQEDNEEEPKVG